jgi:predicted nucleic acid-binding protein
MALVLDTGVIFAALDASDAFHGPCAELLETHPNLVVPAPVFVEVERLCQRFATLDAWSTLCEDVYGGAYTIYPLDAPLLYRAAELQRKYKDLPLGLVDATVLVTCDALGEERVATLDHRHFSVVQSDKGHPFEILPEIS